MFFEFHLKIDNIKKGTNFSILPKERQNNNPKIMPNIIFFKFDI